MASGLPRLPFRDGIAKKQQIKFSGFDRRDTMTDGALCDALNLSSELYPTLGVRDPRRVAPVMVSTPRGITGGDKLCYVSGDKLYYNGVQVSTVSASDKQFAMLGDYIIILPDKAYYDIVSGQFGKLEEKYIGAAGAISFANGTYAGKPANGNALITTGTAFTFKVGDAVTISGCVTHPENNKTPIIREISSDKKTLFFYENTFAIGSESGAVTVARTVPDMDYICSNDNRLWGCKGDTVYASKLGDPFNWNVFDGVATDSFAVDTGSAGKFTGACSYLGYPVFFKEDAIYKVYGSKPSNYELLASASLGVAEGSAASLAIAGERLFYLSRTGVMMYTGGIPSPVGEPLGGILSQGVGGSDGMRYYLCASNAAGAHEMFVFDTERGMWQREVCSPAGVCGFAYVVGQGLYMLERDGVLSFLRGTVPPADYISEEIGRAHV